MFTPTTRINVRSFPVQCSYKHPLPIKYWGQDCPVCRLIEINEQMLHDTSNESNDLLKKVLDEVREMYM